MSTDFKGEALAILRQALGPSAQFRSGQLEAITSLVQNRSRLLIVQRTGWGKSAVYFVATRLLRTPVPAPPSSSRPCWHSCAIRFRRRQSTPASNLTFVAQDYSEQLTGLTLPHSPRARPP